MTQERTPCGKLAFASRRVPPVSETIQALVTQLDRENRRDS
ncbi:MULTISPECIES: hypothetical protein [Rhizobium]|nr:MULTISPECIES: hypothetical protein [Rhizobium]WET75222.1 hypothetical protein PYR68_06875 [Rhizobium croatiense]